MIGIRISEKIQAYFSELVITAIECEVKNSFHDIVLWEEISDFSGNLRHTYALSDIKNHPAILATRKAYKKLGKDPNRYRPSAEALCRRIVKGLDLYQINTLVDAINLLSLKTGYSIGGFDAKKIEGDLVLGVGRVDETFDAIGRGKLNIENLPVYRDSISGIGTPTSDVERTKISLHTSRLLVIINAYSGNQRLNESVEYATQLLKKYACASSFHITTYNSNLSKY